MTAPRSVRRGGAVLGAVASAVVIWLVAVPVLGHPLKVGGRPGQPPLEVALSVVTLFAFVASLAGWALLAVLERLTGRARAVWTIIAIVVLLLSFLPLTGPDTALATRLALGLMHVTVAAVLVPVLWRTSPPPAVSRPE